MPQNATPVSETRGLLYYSTASATLQQNMRRGSHNSLVATPALWLPKSYQDLELLPATNVIYDADASKLVCPSPGVLIKYRGDLSEEVRAMRFARDVVLLPVPKILRHPPLHRRRMSNYSPSGTDTSGVWYICREQRPGISLDKVINTLNKEELDHIADQLKLILTQMASVRSTTLGSVTGGPYCNFFFPSQVAPKYAFTSAGEFIDHYRQMLMLFCTETFTESVLSQLPRNAAIRFAHGDLLPRNIIVNGSNITGIVDWSTAGFYPEYWEYCRMHDPNWITAGWDHVLHRIFPTPRRQIEIDGVRQLMDIVAYTF